MAGTPHDPHWLRGGVRQVADPATAAQRDARAAGWRTGVVAGTASKREFLSEVGCALGFPAYYRGNLDALWDCLTDLTAPTALVWVGWEELAVRHPRDWAALIELLAERGELEPPFAVLLSQGTHD